MIYESMSGKYRRRLFSAKTSSYRLSILPVEPVNRAVHSSDQTHVNANDFW